MQRQMQSIFLAGPLACLVLSCKSAPVVDPGAIPGDVTDVATGRAHFGDRWSDFRLVITGSCPDECFSRGRLEWVDGWIPGTSTVWKTQPIGELESALVVQGVQFIPESGDEPARFEIGVVNTYTNKPGLIRLAITGVGTHEAALIGDPLGAPDE
ncbi:MAG TPA: hypothetical protein VMW19_17000 [Myxococcota bacterium]|nr:hypothetical protein [Myxococcota bacterium]